jgi:hypothetical protein
VSVIYVIMRTKFLALFLSLIAVAGGASAAVIVEKRSRQLPYVEVFGCQGVHSFVFRGPTGTSRRPILVPPREYWTAQEAGLYKFILRYHSGNVRSRLVTPAVFARYQVGEDFYDREARDRYESDDSKTIQPVVHQRQTTAQVRQRKTTAQVRQRTQKRKTYRAVAKHRKTPRSKRLAQR